MAHKVLESSAISPNRGLPPHVYMAPSYNDQIITALLRNLINGRISIGIPLLPWTVRSSMSVREQQGFGGHQVRIFRAPDIQATAGTDAEGTGGQKRIAKMRTTLAILTTRMRSKLIENPTQDDPKFSGAHEIPDLPNTFTVASFAALASSNPTSAQTEDTCSAKSVYKLADEVGLDSLQTLALAAINQRITTESV